VNGSPPPLATVDRPRLAASGLLLLWASLAMLMAGAWRYDGSLIWLGLTGLIVLGWARWWAPRNLSGLSVSRECPARIFAGEALDWTLRVDGEATPGARLLPRGLSVEIRDSLLPRQAPGVKFSGLWPGDLAEGPLRTRLFRRGRDTRADYEMVSGFPFGLFETRARGPILDRLPTAPGGGRLVFPQPAMPESLRRDLEWARFEADFPQGFEPDPGGEFRGVRAYRGGDPVKSVHWAATARVGELMVREWDPPAPKPLRFGLILHTLEPAGTGRMLRPDRWETILRLFTGLVVYCRGAGIPLTIADITGATRAEATHWMRIPEQKGFGAALEWAALATRSGVTQPAALAAALSRLGQSCDRIFVLSDVPMAAWRSSATPPSEGTTMVCIDAEAVTTIRPGSPRRSVIRKKTANPGSPR
jgi:hypothetical protein